MIMILVIIILLLLFVIDVINDNRVHEGNWIVWLASQKKINSYVWIGYENSPNKDRNYFNKEVVPNYLNVERENYKFGRNR